MNQYSTIVARNMGALRDNVRYTKCVQYAVITWHRRLWQETKMQYFVKTAEEIILQIWGCPVYLVLKNLRLSKQNLQQKILNKQHKENSIPSGFAEYLKPGTTYVTVTKKCNTTPQSTELIVTNN